MKTKIRKVSAVTLGMIVGFLLGTSAEAQGTFVPTPGQPYASQGGGARGRFGSIQQVGMFILELIQVYLIPIIMSFGMLAFLWGVAQYIRKGSDPKEREQGRQFMLWGIIGLAVMASVWGLVRILTNTLGVPLGIPSTRDIQ